MLSLFRGKSGTYLVVGLLSLVLVGLLVTGIGTPGGGFNGISSLLSIRGNAVAQVGNIKIERNDVSLVAENILESQRQQQPNLTMQGFIGNGMLDQVINHMVEDRALVVFGMGQGMAISKRSIDAELNDAPVLRGSDGKFDHNLFDRWLADHHMSEQQFRDNRAEAMLAEQIGQPIEGATIMP
ncbi:MAG: SurA N-terminal domain-containing protein, partial [Alphaproteobacteria bacterium]|nr:SurA N-terminal domain-containing protein [Alphaproteobacteria bacterium]